MFQIPLPLLEVAMLFKTIVRHRGQGIGESKLAPRDIDTYVEPLLLFHNGCVVLVCWYGSSL